MVTPLVTLTNLVRSVYAKKTETIQKIKYTIHKTKENNNN